MATVKLRVRKNEFSGWIENFSSYGWHIRYNGSWLLMGPWNTKLRSADNSSWLDTK